MTRYSIPPPPSRPWTGRLHLALTLLLVVAAAGIAGLASAGKLQFGQKPVADDSKSKIEGRYQIEKVEDVHEILDRAGQKFFGTEMYDTWIFKYKGGLVETTLETDIDGKTFKLSTVPDNWNKALPLQKTLTKDSEVPVKYTGYIIVSAMRSDLTEFEILEPYLAHLGGILAFGSVGPALSVVPSIFLEVKQFRPYRIFVTANPPPDVSGQGFNIRDHERAILISTPLIIKNPAVEEAFFGGGKDLKPGKEETILDRERGYTRIRLKARFLGDGEVRELMPK